MSARYVSNLLALTVALVLAAAWQVEAIGQGDGPALLSDWRHAPLALLIIVGCWQLIGACAAAGDAMSAGSRGVGWMVMSAMPAVLLTLLGLYVWQVVVIGLEVPVLLLPAPAMIWDAMAANSGTLWEDFVQTVVKSVLPGYAIGCVAGFGVATLAWRFPVLSAGLLPLGNFMSVLPIVGVAPIMVMWFGFDWQSKAAVAVLMVFFPMLVNSLAGLGAAGQMENDLMRTYAASRGERFLKVALPAAMPFIFNGLKISFTLALIGAIVAEFFGTPIVGMGFRISSEVGRMGLDVVWATIVVSAVVGTSAYGLLLALERMVTFWDASWR